MKSSRQLFVRLMLNVHFGSSPTYWHFVIVPFQIAEEITHQSDGTANKILKEYMYINN